MIVSTDLTDVTMVSEDTCGDDEDDDYDEEFHYIPQLFWAEHRFSAF